MAERTAAMIPQRPAQVAFRIHPIYRIFFLVLEPISALVGAFYSHFRQDTYLTLLDAPSAPSPGPGTATSVALSQLANMYLFFAINEALVLRSTADLRVWRTVLLGLLIADVGHLLSLGELGTRVYWDVGGWNVGDLGNVPWVYVGATMRVCFLAGVGLGESRALKRKDWKS
ncbi:hypothetical protein ACJ41O_003902 [Fusarium nematophilum]